MKVGFRVDRALRTWLDGLEDTDRRRVLEEAVILVTERLNHGVKRRLVRIRPVDLDREVGLAFERAILQNRPAAEMEMDKALRPILAREELRSR